MVEFGAGLDDGAHVVVVNEAQTVAGGDGGGGVEALEKARPFGGGENVPIVVAVTQRGMAVAVDAVAALGHDRDLGIEGREQGAVRVEGGELGRLIDGGEMGAVPATDQTEPMAAQSGAMP